MSSWDDEDNEVPTATVSNGAGLQDRWDGEDEEVADAWDAEEEEDETSEKGSESGVTKKPRRRALQDIIAEKEAKRAADLAAKKAAIAAAEKEAAEMTPEQIRRAQEESDLMLAKETFGVGDAPVLTKLELAKSIDAANPQTKEDFDKLRALLQDKLLPYEKSAHFPGFLDSLLRELTTNQDVECLKRLSTMLAAMANEKVKQQRGKSKKKGAAKGKIATIRDNDFQNDATPDFQDDFDDFM